jgi:hypothetical protein
VDTGPDDISNHQLVFVGGLHRSGTSFIARMLAGHPLASGLTGTNVPEDEGQHVQDVYDPANRHGGPGRFAFSPAMRLTEQSVATESERSEKAAALSRAWAPHFDLSKPTLVEKSPPNLTKSLYLQALFPEAYFVMVMRHPIAVAIATARWSKTSRHSLVAHWLQAYEIMAGDLPRLKHAATLRYEDMVADPQAEYQRLLRFLGMPLATTSEPVRTGVNEKYYRAWERGAPWSRWSSQRASRDFAGRVARFGYSLVPPYVAGPIPADLRPMGD